MTIRRGFFVLIAVCLVLHVQFMPSVSASTVKQRPSNFDDLFNQAEAAFKDKNLVVAEQGFAEVLARRPEHAKARFRLGQVLALSGRPQQALPHFEELLRQNPGHITGRCFLGQVLADLGSIAEARSHLEWILKVQPEHEEAKAILSRILQSYDTPAMMGAAPKNAQLTSERYELMPSAAANQVKGPIEQIAPKDPQPIMLGQGTVPPVADDQVKGWRVSDFLGASSDSAYVAFEYAKYCLERDDLEKAALHFNRAETMVLAKQDTRRFLEIQIYKGMVCLYREDVRGFGQLLFKIKPMLSKETYQSFLDMYQKASQASSPVDVSRLVGGIAMGAEHYVSAARLLGKAIAQNPNDVLALRMKAQCELESRNYSAAERSFLVLAQKQPDDPEVYLNLARFYLTARFDPALARQHAQMAANLNPGDSRLLVLFSVIDLFDGKIKEAETRLKKAVKMTDDPALANMAKRILKDPSLARGPESRARLASFLLLPGAAGAASESLRELGESYLQRGSSLSALKIFIELKDLAEIGRTYLSMASQQFAVGEEKAASVTAGYGMNALNEELRLNPSSARAHLYLALYYSQRKDCNSCMRHVQAGLKCPASGETRRQLLALKGALT